MTSTTSVGVISNPAGVHPPSGETTSTNKTFTGLISQYVAAAAITAGQVVYLNTSLQAVKAATGTAPELVIGVAITSAGAAGEVISVCHLGVARVLAETAVNAAGLVLVRSGSTAGSVDVAAAPGDDAESGTIGVSITAESGGYIWAFISPSPVHGSNY